MHDEYGVVVAVNYRKVPIVSKCYLKKTLALLVLKLIISNLFVVVYYSEGLC